MICTSRSSVLLIKGVASDVHDRSELMKYTCKEFDVVIEFSQFAQFFQCPLVVLTSEYCLAIAKLQKKLLFLVT